MSRILMSGNRMLPNRRHLLAGAAATAATLSRARHRACAGRRPEGRRPAAALGLRGQYRSGLPARRRDRARDPQIVGAARPHDHQRRHRIERRCRAHAHREADRRRRAASGGRIRFRPDHRDRPGRRAEGHPARHQYRGGARYHRAGLQVRIPQFPDRGDDPGRCFRQPEGDLRRRRRGAEDGRLHARERHIRNRHVERHQRGDAEVRPALQDRRGDLLRSAGARSFRRGGEGQGDERRDSACHQSSQ